jgi:hypothetical protein
VKRIKSKIAAKHLGTLSYTSGKISVTLECGHRTYTAHGHKIGDEVACQECSEAENAKMPTFPVYEYAYGHIRKDACVKETEQNYIRADGYRLPKDRYFKTLREVYTHMIECMKYEIQNHADHIVRLNGEIKKFEKLRKEDAK